MIFNMNMFLIRCKGEGLHNEVFQNSIDNILEAGKDYSGRSIKWIFLLRGETERLEKRIKQLDAQIHTAQRAHDEEKVKALLPEHKDTVEAAANMVQLLQNTTKSIEV